MKILVLGGTGFLGSRIVDRLINLNHTVSVITRNEDNIVKLQEKGVQGYVGDLMNPVFIKEIPNHDFVVNVAMPLEFGRISKKKLDKMRKRTTKFVSTALMAGRQFDCPTVLTLGTSFKTEGNEVADESWPLVREGLAAVGDEADEIILDAVNQGQPIIRMYPGQIYGPGGQMKKMYDMMMSGKFGLIGDGENYIPRIHVEDCAEAFVLAIEKNAVGEKYIIADDTPVTMKDFTYYMAELAGKEKVRKIPKLLARLIMGKALVKTMEMNCIVTNEKAKRELGWSLRYPSYKEGLKVTIAELDKSGG
ncbi:MAG: NAD-dependent epimerase/dehydratase family protein [Candidatus Lokiarchaeota archaeon]|nr:NAD-dependent epimerase/dehydratase family protein [Candidatus Lokiarchaeota archaeon]